MEFQVQALAPEHKISATTVINYRKDFARWLYTRLDSSERAFLDASSVHAPDSVPRTLWPIMHAYLMMHHPDAVADSERLLQLANMGKPHKWYPLAASIQRRVVYHAGPTNSGKTFNLSLIHI